MYDGIDFGRHSDDYATHRPGFPASFFQRLDATAPLAGSRSLDLATGPGTIALELGALGSMAVGIDVSRDQIEAARRVCRARNLAHAVRFCVAKAEQTGLATDTFDLVTAGQCWHWFDNDGAMAEARRLLRPRGLLAIAYYSYLPAQSPVAAATEQLILEFNPSWTMAGSTGRHPERVDALVGAGFQPLDTFCYDHDEPFTHERWCGRMRTCNGVGSGGLSPPEVRRFDDALRHLLEEHYPDRFVVPHRVWCVMGRNP